MTTVFARKALLPDGWADDVLLRIRDGLIDDVSQGEAPGGRTVGQMSSDEKHALSHRGKAARAMAAYLEGEGW